VDGLQFKSGALMHEISSQPVTVIAAGKLHLSGDQNFGLRSLTCLSICQRATKKLRAIAGPEAVED